MDETPYPVAPHPSRDWQALEAEIVACRRCSRLVAWREEVARTRRRAYRDQEYWGRPVPGFGDQAAQVLVLGLAPGAHGSNRTGRMFTGDSSGDFLYAALHRAGFASRPIAKSRDDGLTLQGLFISAACRCAPPDNKPLPEEITACRPFLARELVLLGAPRVVVALGRVAFDVLWQILRDPLPAGVRQPDFAHGAAYRLRPDGPWLLASYHPSRQNTQTGRLTAQMFDAVWQRASTLIADA